MSLAGEPLFIPREGGVCLLSRCRFRAAKAESFIPRTRLAVGSAIEDIEGTEKFGLPSTFPRMDICNAWATVGAAIGAYSQTARHVRWRRCSNAAMAIFRIGLEGHARLRKGWCDKRRAECRGGLKDE